MIGREYSNYLDVLFHSFSMMSEKYEAKKEKQNKILKTLQKLYIKTFGIPEIGLQLRSLYFREFISHYENYKFRRILDAGSGIGLYSLFLAKKFPKSHITGVDIDRYNLKLSNKIKRDLRIENIRFKYADLTKKDKNKFALIVNIDVLEHIKDYKLVLRNFYNSLEFEGMIYIHTPQDNQKRLFRALENWEHEDHVHEGFNPKILKKVLDDIGFERIEMRSTFGFFGSLAWELNHLALTKGFTFAGIIYPLAFIIGSLDLLIPNNKGLGVAVVARKPKRTSSGK